MKKTILYLKFALDTLMAVTFVLLFNDRVLGGLTFHEAAGLGIGIAFLTHLSLNVSWIKRVTLKLFDRKLPGKTRFSYFLNLLLLAGMAFIIVSGILVSRIVFPQANMGDHRWIEMAHRSVSFLVLIVVGVHVGLHWQWVIGVIKTLFRRAAGGAPLGIALKLATVAILAFGCYRIYESKFLQQVKSVSAVVGQSPAMGPGRGERFGERGGRPFLQGNPPSDSEGGVSAGEGTESRRSEGFGGRDRGVSGGFEGGFESRREGGPGGISPLNVLLTYLGIMSVFVIATYYLDKWTTRRKRAPQAASGRI
ncbi:DUF4405 domain-containing protein [Cohnella caldifontis]|uniref:DUF4405 domain-containing protein n=1 Tax=Cohnella caldifontis TaxID=3027471 RepID=UPI0023ED252F|nr:DUF4405 domain-containing protein [Cohnella sp. YIM B05605]